jgi:hypothetical protein
MEKRIKSSGSAAMADFAQHLVSVCKAAASGESRHFRFRKSAAKLKGVWPEVPGRNLKGIPYFLVSRSGPRGFDRLMRKLGSPAQFAPSRLVFCKRFLQRRQRSRGSPICTNPLTRNPMVSV